MGDRKLTPGRHGEHAALSQDRKCERSCPGVPAQSSQRPPTSTASGGLSVSWLQIALSPLPHPHLPNPSPSQN